MIEDIFALAVRFQVAGQGARDSAPGVLQYEMLTEPARVGDRAAGLLQRPQEGMRQERIVGREAAIARCAGQAAPFRGIDRGKPVMHPDNVGVVGGIWIVGGHA